MPIIVGNSTVNSAITSTSVTENTPQGFAEYNATRNSVMPTLRFDFVNSNVLDPRITFTRSSNATYFNSAGVLTTALNNVPRFDYNPATLACNGLLMEQFSTNLFLNSSSPGVNTTSWGGGTAVTITNNATTGPDGTASMVRVSGPSGAGGEHFVQQILTPAVSTTYTYSVYAKAAEYNTICLRIVYSNGANDSQIRVNLSTGAVISTANAMTLTGIFVQFIGNGIYRIGYSFTTPATNPTSSLLFRIQLVDGTGQTVFIGDGVSGLYIWGAQLEALAFPTSYIATTSTTATRSEDRAVINTFSSYNSPNATGTILSEFMFTTIPVTGAHRVWVMTNDTTSTNLIDLYHQVGQNFVYPIFTVAGVSTSWYNTSLNNFTVNVPLKHTFAWNVSGPTEKQASSGSYYGLATSSISNTANYQLLYIGSSWYDGSALYGYVRKFAYYPVYLSNNELISLTS
jgi:hypothetical protein